MSCYARIPVWSRHSGNSPWLPLSRKGVDDYQPSVGKPAIKVESLVPNSDPDKDKRRWIAVPVKLRLSSR